MLGFLTAGSTAWALPAPPTALLPLDPSWTEITLRVDLRNLSEALENGQEIGKIAESQLRERLNEVNRIWSQCGLRFAPRVVANVRASSLGVPYQPQSQEDLSRLAAALNPSGFTALPVTVAGPWTFREGGYFLTGLGWAFTRGDRIDRIGAMISATKFFDVSAAPIIAHELAHALSLPHVPEGRNLMGPGGTNELTSEQCRQARRFADAALGELREQG
ncbi:MAG: hypothetical protein NDJ90_08355 [Oligoflexia bacterium]|nr:hypothetical protein [Oligoflexia bacterium]